LSQKEASTNKLPQERIESGGKERIFSSGWGNKRTRGGRSLK